MVLKRSRSHFLHMICEFKLIYDIIRHMVDLLLHIDHLIIIMHSVIECGWSVQYLRIYIIIATMRIY